VPTITVGIPAYNAGKWIDATLESVLAQTRPADEIVVVDDGSTDDTAERARAHGDRVRVVSQSNAGAPAAYNTVFGEARSDYVAMCPADDLWDPHKLKWQAEALEQNPKIDIAFGRAEFFGLRNEIHPHPQSPGIQDPVAFKRAMYVEVLIPAPTAVVRRALHQRLGPFDESLPGEDYEFWMRALRAGAVFHYDPRLMVRLRHHGSNASGQALAMWEMNRHVHLTYAADLADPGLTKSVMAKDLRWIARARFGLGDAAGAAAAYSESLHERPSVEAAIGSVVFRRPLGRPLAALNQRRKRRPA
jgi:glycosyltransferase involved in cell wall biosynthesis